MILWLDVFWLDSHVGDPCVDWHSQWVTTSYCCDCDPDLWSSCWCLCSGVVSRPTTPAPSPSARGSWPWPTASWQTPSTPTCWATWAAAAPRAAKAQSCATRLQRRWLKRLDTGVLFLIILLFMKIWHLSIWSPQYKLRRWETREITQLVLKFNMSESQYSPRQKYMYIHHSSDQVQNGSLIVLLRLEVELHKWVTVFALVILLLVKIWFLTYCFIWYWCRQERCVCKCLHFSLSHCRYFGF